MANIATTIAIGSSIVAACAVSAWAFEFAGGGNRSDDPIDPEALRRRLGPKGEIDIANGTPVVAIAAAYVAAYDLDGNGVIDARGGAETSRYDGENMRGSVPLMLAADRAGNWDGAATIDEVAAVVRRFDTVGYCRGHKVKTCYLDDELDDRKDFEIRSFRSAFGEQEVGD